MIPTLHDCKTSQTQPAKNPNAPSLSPNLSILVARLFVAPGSVSSPISKASKIQFCVTYHSVIVWSLCRADWYEEFRLENE